MPNLCFQNDIHDGLGIVSAGFFQILPVTPQWFILQIQNLKKFDIIAAHILKFYLQQSSNLGKQLSAS